MTPWASILVAALLVLFLEVALPSGKVAQHHSQARGRDGSHPACWPRSCKPQDMCVFASSISVRDGWTNAGRRETAAALHSENSRVSPTSTNGPGRWQSVHGAAHGDVDRTHGDQSLHSVISCPQDGHSAPETVPGGRQRGVLCCPLGERPGQPFRPPARLTLRGEPHQQGRARQGAEAHAGDRSPAHGGCCPPRWGCGGPGARRQGLSPGLHSGIGEQRGRAV